MMEVVFACFLVAPSIFFFEMRTRTLRFDIVVISVVINAFRFYRRLDGMVLRLSVLVVCVWGGMLLGVLTVDFIYFCFQCEIV